jgi:hypothetical protein
MNTVSPVHGARQTSLASLRLSRLLVALVAAYLACLVQAATVADAAQVTRFQRTVQYLQDASPTLRSDFAATALSSLASAYRAEAALARQEARKAGSHGHLWAWSVKVEHYASQVPLLLDDIELGLPVRLTLAGEKSLAITVADRTIILSHPRLNEQDVFEQGILNDFCASHRCEQFSPDTGGVEPIAAATAHIRPDWSFTAQESLCAYQGIRLRFNSVRNMANSRLICEQLLQEVMALTDELAWQQRHAVTIAWDQLEVQATPHRPEHRVRLNTLGDTVQVTIPMLYRSSELFRQVLPWMRQRVNGQPEVRVDLDAGHYGWQKP